MGPRGVISSLRTIFLHDKTENFSSISYNQKALCTDNLQSVLLTENSSPTLLPAYDRPNGGFDRDTASTICGILTQESLGWLLHKGARENYCRRQPSCNIIQRTLLPGTYHTASIPLATILTHPLITIVTHPNGPATPSQSPATLLLLSVEGSIENLIE